MLGEWEVASVNVTLEDRNPGEDRESAQIV